MPKSDALLGTNIPFVQAHHVGPKQRPTAIVLRTSFTTGIKGAALGLANAWHYPNNRIDSCHYAVDEFQVIRCIPDRLSCQSAYTDCYKNSITINVCYDPPDEPSDLTMHRTAKQVGRLCRLHRIKVRMLDSDQEKQWIVHPWKRRGGIVIATSGDFPINRFLSSVQEAYRSFD
jgi:hypothetical protein